MTESGAHPLVERAATTCRRCRARIAWTTTEAGKSQAVNLVPDTAGTIAVRVDHVGRVRSRTLSSERSLLEGAERLHVAHAATCGRTATAPIPARADGVTPLYLARERRQQRQGGRS